MKYKITLEAELESEFYSSSDSRILAASLLKDLELGYIGFNDLKTLDFKAEEIKP